MTPETPLPEVAKHLPAEAAQHLGEFSEQVMVGVLTQVRSVVVYWESQRYVFEPVAYEAILNALVASLATPYAEYYRLFQDNARLQSQLLRADQVISDLSASIAHLSEGTQKP